jgi:hypothetical protein
MNGNYPIAIEAAMIMIFMFIAFTLGMYTERHLSRNSEDD